VTECLRCQAKSQTYLCPRDVTLLQEWLAGLPRFLRFLREAALGQSRLGAAQRRRRGDEQPLSLNLRAADLLGDAQSTLSTLVSHLCASRGVPMPETDMSGLCAFLSANVWAIAADEAADEHMGDIEDLIERIDRCINRPSPPKFLGPCITDPAPDDVLSERRDHGDHETRCGRALVADRTARTVDCSQCHRTHDIESVMTALLEDAGHMLITVAELVDWVLPRLEEPVPRRTLERWIQTGEIPVRGNDSRGAVMVQLAEVRAVRRRRPRHGKASPRSSSPI
jgi:hypothetical protein